MGGFGMILLGIARSVNTHSPSLSLVYHLPAPPSPLPPPLPPPPPLPSSPPPLLPPPPSQCVHDAADVGVQALRGEEVAAASGEAQVPQLHGARSPGAGAGREVGSGHLSAGMQPRSLCRIHDLHRRKPLCECDGVSVMV